MQVADMMRPTLGEVRAFYRSAEWRAMRGHVLHLQSPACRRCGRRKRLEVDHIVPVRVSWEARLDLRNLQVLCHRCHRSDKRREERQWAR